VAPVSSDDIAELYEIRLLLEPAAAELAAERASDAELAVIRSFAERLEDSPVESRTITDVDQYMAELTLDQDFHSRVVHAAGNRRLSTLYDGLRSHVLLVRFTFPVLTRTRPRRHGEHLRVTEAMEARDGASARRAMETHLRNAKADVLDRIRGAEGDGVP
jgi:DNA-binding GntR family transcriptional regulator